MHGIHVLKNVLRNVRQNVVCGLLSVKAEGPLALFVKLDEGKGGIALRVAVYKQYIKVFFFGVFY